MKNLKQIKALLDQAFNTYHRPDFVKNDPIGIPRRFSRLQDIEIMAFWTAVLSWGLRKTIINKADELIRLMDGAPYDFIMNHQAADLKRLELFKHRTFQPTDTLYFIHFLRHHYSNHDSLEEAFAKHLTGGEAGIKDALMGFHQYFFSLPEAPARTRKHIPTPARGSSCKRLNMLLRWMVRPNEGGVDFGLWKKINPAQLYIPLDVHVERVARKLGLLTRKGRDWKAVEELTSQLRKLDPKDPVKYDFALFGMGINGDI